MKKLLKLMLVIALLYCSAEYKDIKSSLIDGYVGDQVVKMTNLDGDHGGTGFHVKTPSGKTYILTNAHVCDHVGKDGQIYVSTDFQRPIPRKIIESSPVTDLCLVEPLPNHVGLKVAEKEDFRKDVEVMGHPQLLPLTPSHGELTGMQKINVMDHMMNPEDENDKCDLPKNQIISVNFFGLFNFKACTININANSSNITILPGNSGSPLVNSWGRVQGVAFAGNSSSNWGWFVTLKDVKEFLTPY